MKRPSSRSLTTVLFTALLLFVIPVSINFENAGGLSISLDFLYAEASLWSALGGLLDTVAKGILYVIASFWEFIIYNLTALVAALTGWILDFFIKHSISSATYRSGMVEAGWEILRNLVNVVFIFAIIRIAFEQVLSIGKDYQKKLLKTLLVALVLNFSIFAAYLVIDVSNIFANLIYERIVVEVNTNTTESNSDAVGGLNEFFGNSEIKSMSVAVVSRFNPQRLAATAGLTQISSSSDYDQIFQYLQVITMAGILNIVLIYVFVTVIIFFLSRTVGLIFLSILSAIVFAGVAIPGLTKKKYIGFSWWVGNLINLAFMAPVYIFFMYLVITFATNDAFLGSLAVTSSSTGEDFISLLLRIFLPFALIMALILSAKDVAKKMAGDLGNMIAGAAQKALVGAAVGAAVIATGGAAAVGTGLRGVGLASRAATRGRSNGFSRALSAGGRRLQGVGFDVSKMPGFKQTFGSGIGAQVARRATTSSIRNAQDFDISRRRFAANLSNRQKRRDAEYQRNRRKIENEALQWQQTSEEDKIRNTMSNDKNISAQRAEEQDAYTDMTGNTQAVEQETKALNALDKSIEDLKAQLNAAKGSNNPAIATQIQEDIEIQKIIKNAMKQGVNITASQAEDMRYEDLDNGGNGTAASVHSNKGKSGFGLSSGYLEGDEGRFRETTSYKSRHEYERKKLQEQEKKAIDNHITQLNNKNKKKLAQKIANNRDSLLTDSSKKVEDKK